MTSLQTITSHWWIVVLRGVLALALAGVAFGYPFATAAAFVILFGAYAFVEGGVVIVTALRFAHPDSGRWWWMLAQGLIGIAIGVWTFFYPGITAFTLGILVAAWAISTGILEVGAALRLRRDIPGEILLITAGSLSVVLGLALAFINGIIPLAGLFVAVYAVGFYAVLIGIALIALGLKLRGMRAGVGAA
jgi:uncharacterized membrane protein HdeD (DUF308 family)